MTNPAWAEATTTDFIQPMAENDPADAKALMQAAGLPMVAEPRRGFVGVGAEKLNQIAEMMANSGPMVPPAFQVEIVGDKAVGRCRAVAYQADRWGMDPIAVCQKAYVTVSDAKGADGKALLGPDQKVIKAERIGYEAQLVHAVVLALAPIKGRPSITYGYSDPAKKYAAFRFCRVEMQPRDGGPPLSVVSPTVAQIKVKNSPLWISDPDQQLAYYTCRAFARRHFPEVLMGIYTREELQVIAVQSDGPRRSHFEEDETPPEPTDAEFEDKPIVTDADEKGFKSWEDRQNGVDSRDPRNQKGPPAASAGRPAPPKENPAPTSAAEEKASGALTWAAGEQLAILDITDLTEVERRWQTVRADKRWNTLKSYNQVAANLLRSSVADHVAKLKVAKDAGADPSTGEVS